MVAVLRYLLSSLFIYHVPSTHGCDQNFTAHVRKIVWKWFSLPMNVLSDTVTIGKYSTTYLVW